MKRSAPANDIRIPLIVNTRFFIVTQANLKLPELMDRELVALSTSSARRLTKED